MAIGFSDGDFVQSNTAREYGRRETGEESRMFTTWTLCESLPY